jgi:hypothetical protein
MSATETILDLTGAFDEIGLPYMLAGSTASSFCGFPSFTQRENVLVQTDSVQLESLATTLGGSFNVSPMTTHCSIDHPTSAFRIELLPVGKDPHDRTQFQRRRQVYFENWLVWMPTVDDVVITKLRWSKEGRRATDVEDVKKILFVRSAQLDLPYIRQWTDQHGTRDLFEKLLKTTSHLS